MSRPRIVFDDGLRLLEDLLQHEVVVPAALDLREVPLDPLDGAPDAASR